jgi:hypothetical protein
MDVPDEDDPQLELEFATRGRAAARHASDD